MLNTTTLRTMRPDLYVRLQDIAAEYFKDKPEILRELKENLKRVENQLDIVTLLIRKLKEARRKHHFTLDEISQRTSLPRQSIWRLENHLMPNPTIQTIQRYALAVGYELKFQLRQGKKVRRKKKEGKMGQGEVGKMSVEKGEERV